MLNQSNVSVYLIAEIIFYLNVSRPNRRNFLGLRGEGRRGSRSDPVFVKGELKRKHLCQVLSDGQV